MKPEPLSAFQQSQINEHYSNPWGRCGIVSGTVFVGSKDGYSRDNSYAMSVNYDETGMLTVDYANRGSETIEQMINESDDDVWLTEAGTLLEFTGYFGASEDGCEFFNLKWRKV